MFMNPASLLLSSSLATLRSGFCSFLGTLAIIFFFSTHLKAQNDSTKIDTSEFRMAGSPIANIVSEAPLFNKPMTLTKEQTKKRIWLVAGVNVVGYSAVMVGLYNSWYKDFPQSNFHTFNDLKEWQQMDKVGHMYSAYIASRGSMELWRWTGIDRKKRIWIGGMSGVRSLEGLMTAADTPRLFVNGGLTLPWSGM